MEPSKALSKLSKIREGIMKNVIFYFNLKVETYGHLTSSAHNLGRYLSVSHMLTCCLYDMNKMIDCEKLLKELIM